MFHPLVWSLQIKFFRKKFFKKKLDKKDEEKNQKDLQKTIQIAQKVKKGVQETKSSNHRTTSYNPS